MASQEQNFQPQTRDTTNGPNIHTYIPRDDGSVTINGVNFLPQNGVPTAATIPVSVTGAPISTGPVASTYVIPPGAPAIPAVYPQVFPWACNYFPLQTKLPSGGFTAAPFPNSPYAYPASASTAPHVQSISFLANAVPSLKLTNNMRHRLSRLPCIIRRPHIRTLFQYNPSLFSRNHPLPGLPTFTLQQPTFSTFGQTGYEVLNSQLATAQGLEMNKKQEMKPSDDDPMRMYWCRELDGTWTQRNRLTIDSGDIGSCRWYVHDGVFYAVRLPD